MKLFILSWPSLWWKMVTLSLFMLIVYIVYGWKIPDHYKFSLKCKLRLVCEWNHECWHLAWHKPSIRHECYKSPCDGLGVPHPHILGLDFIGCLRFLNVLKNFSSHLVIWEQSKTRAYQSMQNKKPGSFHNKI